MKPVNKPSIYAIRHKESGKVYVGSAVKVLSRWGQHRSQLRKAKHHNPCLQAAWMLHGEEAFEFEVLEYVDDPARLIDRENFHIKRLSACNRELGYNLRKDAASQLGMRHSEASRQRMSRAHAGREKSEEHQAAINEALKGRRLSDEHRAKVAGARRGQTHSEETREKMREAHANPKEKLDPDAYTRMVTANIGRKFSDEHRQKIAAANRKRVLSPETREKISQARRSAEAMKKNSSHLMVYQGDKSLNAEGCES